MRVDLTTGKTQPCLDSSGGLRREMLWRANRGYETRVTVPGAPEPWRDGGYLTTDRQIYVDSSVGGESRCTGPSAAAQVSLRTGHDSLVRRLGWA